jgi:mRNA interferase MazF
MKIEKFGIYLTDLNPGRGTEPGKIRPSVVIQTDLLNDHHPSTIVCPMTSRVRSANLLRVHVPKKITGLSRDSDILVDQIRAVDNRRFRSRIGLLPNPFRSQLMDNLQILIHE